ncbi:MAG: reductive dehalogenase [Burkholderiaceae bacterium]
MGNPKPVIDDQLAGFEVDEQFERFDQKDDVFRRSWHDPAVRSEAAMRFYRTYRETLRDWRKADGFRQQDYALRNAAWHVSDLFTEAREHEDRREGFSDAFTQNREPAPEKADIGDPAQAARDVKRAARLFGAADVGITTVDPRWLYARKFSDMSGTSRENDIPADLDRVIVTVQPMDATLLDTVPSALSGTATGLGYSHDALVVLALAQYIRNLGYRAVASMNDSSLCIPTAIQAGLGEYGRHGLLITPEHGPRIRLGKVFTDMPLSIDAPIRFGVQEFCEQCRRCSDGCPVKAIPDDAPSTRRHNRSNIIGIRKWSVDGEKCFGYWTKQNTDCAICIRVCPFNRDFTRPAARLWRWAVRHGVRRWPSLAAWLVRLDDRLGHGARRKPADWWRQSGKPL